MKMFYLLILVLLLPLFAKDNNRRQFLLCPQRKTTVQQYNLQTSNPSGTLDGNSCKLDFDPQDLYQYLKKEFNNLQKTEAKIDINSECQ